MSTLISAAKRDQNSVASEKKEAKRRRKNAREALMNTPATEDGISVDSFTYFQPNDYELFFEAHQMVKQLVTTDGPYKRKLAHLAEMSITKHNKTSSKRFGTTHRSSIRLVNEVWENVRYAWCPASHELVKDDNACAFTWKTDFDGNGNLPSIVFCDKFIVAKSKQDEKEFLATDEGQKMALLFFFRKVKHEFLHAVQRYLEIKYENRFSGEGVTPDFMTPYKGNDEPEAGDYDEEEDSGGPILPYTPLKKISNKENPLCLYLFSYHGRNKFIPLQTKMVEALLDLNLYFFDDGKFEEEKHQGWCWNPSNSRACKFEKTKKCFNSEFFNTDCFSNRIRKLEQSAKRKKLSSPQIESKKYNDKLSCGLNNQRWKTLGEKYVIFVPRGSRTGYQKRIS